MEELKQRIAELEEEVKRLETVKNIFYNKVKEYENILSAVQLVLNNAKQ